MNSDLHHVADLFPENDGVPPSNAFFRDLDFMYPDRLREIILRDRSSVHLGLVFVHRSLLGIYRFIRDCRADTEHGNINELAFKQFDPTDYSTCLSSLFDILGSDWYRNLAYIAKTADETHTLQEPLRFLNDTLERFFHWLVIGISCDYFKALWEAWKAYATYCQEQGLYNPDDDEPLDEKRKKDLLFSSIKQQCTAIAHSTYREDPKPTIHSGGAAIQYLFRDGSDYFNKMPCSKFQDVLAALILYTQGCGRERQLGIFGNRLFAQAVTELAQIDGFVIIEDDGDKIQSLWRKFVFSLETLLSLFDSEYGPLDLFSIWLRNHRNILHGDAARASLRLKETMVQELQELCRNIAGSIYVEVDASSAAWLYSGEIPWYYDPYDFPALKSKKVIMKQATEDKLKNNGEVVMTGRTINDVIQDLNKKEVARRKTHWLALANVLRTSRRLEICLEDWEFPVDWHDKNVEFVFDTIRGDMEQSWNCFDNPAKLDLLSCCFEWEKALPEVMMLDFEPFELQPYEAQGSGVLYSERLPDGSTVNLCKLTNDTYIFCGPRDAFMDELGRYIADGIKLAQKLKAKSTERLWRGAFAIYRKHIYGLATEEDLPEFEKFAQLLLSAREELTTDCLMAHGCGDDEASITNLQDAAAQKILDSHVVSELESIVERAREKTRAEIQAGNEQVIKHIDEKAAFAQGSTQLKPAFMAECLGVSEKQMRRNLNNPDWKKECGFPGEFTTPEAFKQWAEPLRRNRMLAKAARERNKKRLSGVRGKRNTDY